MQYLCHKLPQIYSVCRNHNLVISSFMTYHRVCNKSNRTTLAQQKLLIFPLTSVVTTTNWFHWHQQWQRQTVPLTSAVNDKRMDMKHAWRAILMVKAYVNANWLENRYLVKIIRVITVLYFYSSVKFLNWILLIHLTVAKASILEYSMIKDQL